MQDNKIQMGAQQFALAAPPAYALDSSASKADLLRALGNLRQESDELYASKTTQHMATANTDDLVVGLWHLAQSELLNNLIDALEGRSNEVRLARLTGEPMVRMPAQQCA